MHFLNWLKRLFGLRRKATGLVPFYDVEVGRVVRIPAAELRQGSVQVKIDGIDELVWMQADQLQPGELRHPPFSDEIREYVRQIQEAFAEHRSLSLDEWEDGFRRDMTPEREIALWLYAAEVYRAFADDEPVETRRQDVYQCIVACLTAGPDSVRRVFTPTALSSTEADAIVNRFFGRSAGK